MTLVRSRIELPDGTPAKHVKVTVRMLAVPRWTDQGDSKVVGVAATTTDTTGWWQIDITPYTEFEDPDTVYAEIIEKVGRPVPDGQIVHFLRVPDLPDPVLMRDLLVPDPQVNPDWSPMPRLGQLRGVDPAANSPADGQVLLVRGGVWMPGAVPARLDQLLDIDPVTFTGARFGDPLVLLDHGKWGIATLSAGIGRDPDDPTGMRAYCRLSRGLRAKTTQVDWGDGSPLENITVGQDLFHPYLVADTYFITVAYTDGSETSIGSVDIGGAGGR